MAHRLSSKYFAIGAIFNYAFFLQLCCSNHCGPYRPLGMEDGTIENNQITASSYYVGTILIIFTNSFYPHFARLNDADYWLTSNRNPSSPWIQVDFSVHVEISGIQTQGGAYSGNHWTKELTVQYGDSEDSLKIIKDDDNFTMTFEANEDRSSIVDITFPKPVIARYLRILPTLWNEWCVMRFEVIGAHLGDCSTTAEPTTTEVTTTVQFTSDKKTTTNKITTDSTTTDRPTIDRTTTDVTTTDSTTTDSTTTDRTTTDRTTTDITTTDVTTTDSTTTDRTTTDITTTDVTTTDRTTTDRTTTNEATETTTDTQVTTTNKETPDPGAITSNVITMLDSKHRSVATQNMPYPYFEVLEKSILFYEAQRSGHLPSSQRVTWRHDSTQQDGSDNGVDLEGGWFDAGDFVKFGLPMAQTATTLAWGAIEFKDAYIAAGQMDWMRDCLKWATDYFVKCHTGTNEFYGQVGDGNDDHAFWGRPENYTGARPSFKLDASNPGSDLVGETAAALAAASMVFRDTDGAYADLLLKHARKLYLFADNYRKKYSDSIKDAKQFYSSSGYGDELAWAAIWLYAATGELDYLNKTKDHYEEFDLNTQAWAFSWDEKTAGVQLLLHVFTRDTQDKSGYSSAIDGYLNVWLPGGGMEYTPKGLAYRLNVGANRYAANTAFLSLVRAKYMQDQSKADDYRDFATSQIDYMLGDGGRSYVVGFGVNPPTHPHHASSSCQQTGYCGWDDFYASAPNPQVLTGALVGGPNKDDYFVNVRTDVVKNDVHTDYNAGFQSAVAGVYDLYLRGIRPKPTNKTTTQAPTTTKAPATTTKTPIPLKHQLQKQQSLGNKSRHVVVSGSLEPECSHLGPIKSLESLTFEKYLNVLECQPDLAGEEGGAEVAIKRILNQFNEIVPSIKELEDTNSTVEELLQKTTNTLEELSAGLDLKEPFVANTSRISVIAEKETINVVKESGWVFQSEFESIGVLPESFEELGMKEESNAYVRFFVMQYNDVQSLKSNATLRFEGLKAFVASGIISLSVFINGEKRSIPTQYSQSLIKNDINLEDGETLVPQCVFWNDKKSNGSWSGFGCRVEGFDEITKSANCYCNHTTNYAVLMRIKPSPPDSFHTRTLSKLTTFGCALSIGALFCGLLVFSFFRHKLLCKGKNVVHVQLMASMFVSTTLFLLSGTAQEYGMVCKIFAIALHYTYLTTFCWMFVEGIHLYRLIVIVYGTEKSLTWLYNFVGWGIPVLIVCVSVGVRYDHYGQDQTCWLSTQNGFSWAFVGPVILIITLNIGVLGIVTRTVVMFSKGSLDHENLASVRSGLKTAFMLLPMLGVAWIFGLLANFHILFAYISVTFNSLQGVWLFVVCCVLNQEVREAIKSKYHRQMNENRIGIDSSANKSSLGTESQDVHIEQTVEVRTLEIVDVSD